MVQQEIVQRARAEAELVRLTRQIEREQATLAAVMASMSDGVVVLDSTGRIQYLNDRAAELVGVDAHALIG